MSTVFKTLEAKSALSCSTHSSFRQIQSDRTSTQHTLLKMIKSKRRSFKLPSLVCKAIKPKSLTLRVWPMICRLGSSSYCRLHTLSCTNNVAWSYSTSLPRKWTLHHRDKCLTIFSRWLQRRGLQWSWLLIGWRQQSPTRTRFWSWIGGQ